MIGAMPRATSRISRTPRLAVEWQGRGESFRESLRALFAGPRPLKGRQLCGYFREACLPRRFPRSALLASLAIHIGLFHLHIPAWMESKPRAQLALPRIELVYYGPARDLPALRLPGPVKKTSPPGEAKQPLPRKGADAFHPRQTILSTPPRPTHPRQTLIQPEAPPEAPKILPELPNIVQWTAEKQPARPRLNFSPAKPARRRAAAASLDVPVPAVPNLERQPGELNIAASEVRNPRPRLPVAPAAVPRPGPQQASGDAAAAPDIAPSVGNGGGDLVRLVALSASPAEPKSVIEVPPGNLAARLVIAPELQPGVPGGSASGTTSNGGASGGAGSPGGTAASGGGAGGSGAAIADVSISGGAPGNISNVTGPGSLTPAKPEPARATPGVVARPLPERPQARLATLDPVRIAPSSTLEPIKSGAAAEHIFGPRRVYTLYVNAPNLTSSTGSWILRFAELVQKDAAAPGTSPLDDGQPAAYSTELTGPLPVRKVDPRYPPALVSAGVQGDVTLYAIIRRDGSVDSVQVLRSLDPQLDQHAIEALARWKFQPAERNGQPVELEAVVLIPFRIPRQF
jgi:TonB family protein